MRRDELGQWIGGVFGPRACRRNRKFRRHRSQTCDASNFASRDGTKERLLLVRITSGVSCEDLFNVRCSMSNVQFRQLSIECWTLGVSLLTESKRCYCTVTSVPIGISEKNFRAASSGNLMHPCEAG